MGTKKRILLYIILFIAYWLLTLGVLALADYYDDVFVAIIFCFSIFNLIYAFVFLKLHPILNVIISVTVAALGLFLAIVYIDYGYYPQNIDPYGIATAITCNALFSIIIWEIVCQLKLKYYARQ